MPARPYQPSGQWNSGAISLLVAACLGAAVLAGLFEGVLSQWISLLILFPAALGGAVAVAATKVIASSHVRAPWIAALVAGLAGLIAEGTVIGVQYARFRSSLGSEFTHDSQSADEPGGPAVVDYFFAQKTGHTGFVGYLLFQAQLGTRIQHAGRSDSGIKLSGVGFWIMLGIDFLIAAGIAASSAYARANLPYCESCHSWYSKTEPVASGSGDKAAVAGTLRALDSGVFTDLPAAFGRPQPTGVAVFHLLRCDACGDHEPQLHLTVVTGINKKQKTTVAYKSMLRPDEARALLGAFAAARPTPPAGSQPR